MLKHLLIFIALAVHVHVNYAHGLATIPFFSSQSTSTISVQNHPELEVVLEDELKAQRRTNQTLKQLTTLKQISRLESELLTKKLYAEGYYDAKVRASIHQQRIHYRVDTGLVYRLQEIILDLPDEITVPLSVLNLKIGEVLLAEKVLAAKKLLVDFVKAEYCLWQIDVDYQAAIETSSQSAFLTLTLKESPSVRFGEITIQGAQTLNENYLLDRVTIASGDCFKRQRIDDMRLKLLQTNLLVSVTAQMQQPIDNKVPVTFKVMERRHRTVGVGLGYQSDEGASLLLSWEHRNVFGRAQRLEMDAYLGENLQSLSADFNVPHYKKTYQTLNLYTDTVRENSDAFKSELFDLGVSLSRPFKRYLLGTVGIDLSFSNVTEDNVEESYDLLSLPISIEYDRRKNLLDPRQGWRGVISLRPYQEIKDGDVSFFKFSSSINAYYTFRNTEWKPTVAVRTAIGAITGAERQDVPANVRFYSGGGGSVRGYAYQSLGPIEGDDPQGGLSFNEVSLETRFRWSDQWGGVIFMDGGFAYENERPQVGEDLRWGAGLGIRFYTSFAPIRLDAAVPLNQRKDIDDDFHIYISIGQSF